MTTMRFYGTLALLLPALAASTNTTSFGRRALLFGTIAEGAEPRAKGASDPLPIALQTIDFYANISDPRAATPLFKQTLITPLKMRAPGYFNETWLAFTAAPPDPKKFDIAGVDTCPQSSATDCGTPELQLERLSLGLWRTFLRYA